MTPYGYQVAELGRNCSGNGLSPVRQAIGGVNADSLLNGLVGASFDEIRNKDIKLFTQHNALEMSPVKCRPVCLTHWGRVTHICVAYLTIIDSDNGLSPRRRQAIIWTNAEILLIRPLGTNVSEMLIEIHTFSFKKMHLKMSSAKRRPFCLGLNVLRPTVLWCTDMVVENVWNPGTIQAPDHQQTSPLMYN